MDDDGVGSDGNHWMLLPLLVLFEFVGGDGGGLLLGGGFEFELLLVGGEDCEEDCGGEDGVGKNDWAMMIMIKMALALARMITMEVGVMMMVEVEMIMKTAVARMKMIEERVVMIVEVVTLI